jgi:hypothetical protein
MDVVVRALIARVFDEIGETPPRGSKPSQLLCRRQVFFGHCRKQLVDVCVYVRSVFPPPKETKHDRSLSIETASYPPTRHSRRQLIARSTRCIARFAAGAPLAATRCGVITLSTA